jgi:hypothetical protein
MGKISRTDHVKNKEVLQRDKEEKNILRAIERKKKERKLIELIKSCVGTAFCNTLLKEI